MNKQSVLILGAGHLAYRVKKLVESHAYTAIHIPLNDLLGTQSIQDSRLETISKAIANIDLSSLAMVYVLDDRDDYNLELIIALMSLQEGLHITASLFNESITPHLRAAHPNLTILNPAKIAAPVFVKALYQPLEHALRYTPDVREKKSPSKHTDSLIGLLVLAFGCIIASAVLYFHIAEQLSWIDSLYFVVVTIATVGYGDINLLQSSFITKLIGIMLILSSTFFIWMIFSLTIDRVVKKRAQLLLGRKKYLYKNHIILCGLGRLGFFIAEELITRGERLVIVESNEDSPHIEYFRNKGADVYIGNARLPRVLQDIGVAKAQAVISVVNDDYANLEIGLNARSFQPSLRLILRIFDESMAEKIKENLDIHLTLSMSAVADEKFFESLQKN